jgi:hypothetical protein
MVVIVDGANGTQNRCGVRASRIDTDLPLAFFFLLCFHTRVPPILTMVAYIFVQLMCWFASRFHAGCCESQKSEWPRRFCCPHNRPWRNLSLPTIKTLGGDSTVKVLAVVPESK